MKKKIENIPSESRISQVERERTSPVKIKFPQWKVKRSEKQGKRMVYGEKSSQERKKPKEKK